MDKLNKVTNNMADYIRTLRGSMEGKGINPRESMLIIFQLQDLENKLRQLGADKDNPIPFN